MSVHGIYANSLPSTPSEKKRLIKEIMRTGDKQGYTDEQIERLMSYLSPSERTIMKVKKEEKLSAYPNEITSTEGFYLASDLRKQFLVAAPNAAIARKVANMSESIRDSVYTFMNCTKHWKHPTLIKIYDSQGEYNNSRGSEDSLGVSIFFSNKGTKTRIITTYNDPAILRNTLRHEIIHLLIKDLAIQENYLRPGDEKKLGAPLWYEEGVSQYLSSSKEERAALREEVITAIKEKRAYSLERLIGFEKYPDGDDGKSLFYAQSYSLIEYLAQTPHNPTKMRNYATSSWKLEPRRRLVMAFSSDFNNLEEISEGWRNYVERRYKGSQQKTDEVQKTREEPIVRSMRMPSPVINGPKTTLGNVSNVLPVKPVANTNMVPQAFVDRQLKENKILEEELNKQRTLRVEAEKRLQEERDKHQTDSFKRDQSEVAKQVKWLGIDPRIIKLIGGIMGLVLVVFIFKRIMFG